MINKQYNINKKDINFANILALAEPKQYPKICDFCDNIFEVDLFYDNKRKADVKCPVCYSIYSIVYNELNDFNYLEFVRPPDSNFISFSVPL